MFSEATVVNGAECHEVHFSNAQDFLSCLAVFTIKQRPHWSPETCRSGWLFRGHWDATWSMLPSAHRCVEPFEQFSVNLPELSDQDKACHKTYWQKIVAQEAFMLESFQTLANTFSLPCDFSPSIFDELAKMRDDSRNGNIEDWEFFPKSKWYPVLAKAQHHRVPTRLLDFSDDGLLSAYFAASMVWDNQSDSLQTGGKLCVWAFHQNDLQDLHREPDINRQPKGWLRVPAISQLGSNLSSQRGCLILHEGANKFFETNGRWPDFFQDGEAGSNQGRKKKFVKLTLDQANAKEALVLLNTKQICPVTVYPSLDNVSATLRYWHWLSS